MSENSYILVDEIECSHNIVNLLTMKMSSHTEYTLIWWMLL